MDMGVFCLIVSRIFNDLCLCVCVCVFVGWEGRGGGGGGGPLPACQLINPEDHGWID